MAASSPVSFVHGVASGDPYANSVILWTRITPPQGTTEGVDVSWEISRSAGFEAGSIVDSGLFSTSAGRDWTVKVEADGLNADTPYYYRFRAGAVVSMVGQTKTLPVGGDPVRLAVFSCANFPAADTFAAYGRAAAINAVNPYDALVHLGDYIYEYGPGGYGEAENAAGSRGFLPNREIVSLDDYRQRYAQYHTDANLQALRAAAPLIAIWDDHETANDSWAGGAENHQSATEGDWLLRRDAALKAYHEWLPIREPELRQASDGASASSPLTQGYRSFNFGNVLALHILETRLTARDQQLSYPNAAAVQARIGAILADPALVASYATKAGIAPPTSDAAIPAFANALAPLVTQELVIATVQKAWGDPNRDLIGDTQMAWLQQQLASSTAAWQVLGQQVLMQSMALPTELLLNAGNPSLLDKYAAPLQKLATGTPLADLTPAEKALFAEAGKIPYNLDAWDGYGVERETILQSALAAGKRLISLAGDTHNAWAGLLDTMAAGQQPAGTVAGVEFATPGVTSPGLEKYLPGGDAYIRSRYPAVDGLDGLFTGYINGLKYADVNRRGFLDLSVTADQASGSFQFLDGVDPLSGISRWSSETVVASRNLSLSVNPEATPEISWQSGWRELDLVIGMALDGAGSQTLLDPAAYASVPRDGIQLADVTVLGSAAADRIFAGVGSTVDAGSGSDELFNINSLGGNRLVGGSGSDSFFLQLVNDVVIGGQLLSDPASLGLPAVIAQVDRDLDYFNFLTDSYDPAGVQPLRILDYEPGIDKLLLDGVAPQGDWLSIRKQLQDLNVAINAAPQLSLSTLAISLNSGIETTKDLAPYFIDIDGDNLQLVKLAGPEWITVAGTVLKATVPAKLTEAQLAAINLQLGFSDGKALANFTPVLTLNAPPSKLELANATSSLAENSSTSRRIKVADIVITDDALGTEIFSIAGADAASFELDGFSLYLKAGTVLNYEAKSAYSVIVSATDPSLTGSIPVSATFNLSVTDLIEVPGTTVETVVVSIKMPTGEIKQIPVAISGASLSPGSELKIIPVSGINQESLDKLIQSGVTRNSTAIDFIVGIPQGENRASLTASLELVAADLLPQLGDGSGRLSSRKLVYYALNASTGNASPLTYDPITGAGARFFDINNDGTPDFFALSLIDGGYGDKDGLVNAKIDDPSFAGFVDLSTISFSSSASGLLTVAQPGNTAPGAVSLRANLSGRSSSSNQVGYVVLTPDELSGSANLLNDFNWVRGRAKTLLSSLESTDVILPANTRFERDILLINGQSLRFFEVQDASLDQLTSLSDSRFRYLNEAELGNSQASFSSSSGVRFSLSVLPGDPGLNALIGQAQAQAPVLDLTALKADQRLQGTVALGREANFNSVAGFYRALDAQGSIVAADGVTRLRPGDLGYGAAALRTDNLVNQLGNLSVADNQISSRNFVDVTGGSFLAPYALVNGNTFFAYGAANNDGISHFRSLGNNLFGLEDLSGGGDLDYDDLVIGFNFSSLI
jgi:phosphodiesterase/alkaline phosphatase D-like protein